MWCLCSCPDCYMKLISNNLTSSAGSSHTRSCKASPQHRVSSACTPNRTLPSHLTSSYGVLHTTPAEQLYMVHIVCTAHSRLRCPAALQTPAAPSARLLQHVELDNCVASGTCGFGACLRHLDGGLAQRLTLCACGFLRTTAECGHSRIGADHALPGCKGSRSAGTHPASRHISCPPACPPWAAVRWVDSGTFSLNIAALRNGLNRCYPPARPP